MSNRDRPCANAVINCGKSTSCTLTCQCGTCIFGMDTEARSGITVNLDETKPFECFGPTATDFCNLGLVPAPFTQNPTTAPTVLPTSPHNRSNNGSYI